MKKLVYGVGINDADYEVCKYEKIGGKSKQVWSCPFYRAWTRMLRRCYDPKLHYEYPSYKDCYVCQSWLTFSNFKAWMSAQDWQGKQMDKDILSKGNREYGPDSCVFISKNLNCFMMDNKHKRGDLPIGVSRSSKTKKLEAFCKNPFTGKAEYLGCFLTPEDAHEAWRKKKREHAIAYSETVSDRRVKEALINMY